jgi:hypothetical protein
MPFLIPKLLIKMKLIKMKTPVLQSDGSILQNLN